jgi:hypothetical protein
MAGTAMHRSRRSVLHVLAHVPAAAAWSAPFTLMARAQSAPDQPSEKMTKARANYRDTPNGIYSCATCTLFVPPDSCKVVEGEVSRDGWCTAFALAD